MELDQVFSDRDSEDEVDDDIADFEDRRVSDKLVCETYNLCMLYIRLSFSHFCLAVQLL